MKNGIFMFVAIIVVFSIVGCSKTDVNGIWSGKLTPSSDKTKTIGADVKLTQKGKDVSGNIMLKELGAQFNLTGVVEKDKIVFSTDATDGFYMNFKGAVQDKKITGNAELSLQGANIPGGTHKEECTLEITKM